ncbi:MAG: hypothetical protein HOP03_03250 [Lysobacter sp.]|nr:hypothetical protein [Lysobacter sp.]
MLSLSACDSGKIGADAGAGAASTTNTDAGARRQEPDTGASDESNSDGAVSGTEHGPPATRSHVAEQADMDALIAAAEAAASNATADTASGKPLDPAEAAVAAESERQRTALHLTVLVRDRSSGRPVAGIGVGSGRTDAEGRHEERREMPRPKEKITAYCPSRVFLARGRRIGAAPIVVRDGRADAVIEVDATLCVEPPLRKQRMRLAGLYTWGFETSSFVPCTGMPPEATYYDTPGHFWVDMPRVIDRAIERAASPDDDDLMTGRMVYVEWLGTTTGPGQYGHMGMALYHLDVEALYKVSATPPVSCRPDGFNAF